MFPLGKWEHHVHVNVLGDLETAKLVRVGSKVRFHMSFGAGEDATAIEFDLNGDRAARLLKALQQAVAFGDETTTAAAFQLNEEGVVFVGSEHRD